MHCVMLYSLVQVTAIGQPVPMVQVTKCTLRLALKDVSRSGTTTQILEGGHPKNRWRTTKARVAQSKPGGVSFSSVRVPLSREVSEEFLLFLETMIEGALFFLCLLPPYVASRNSLFFSAAILTTGTANLSPPSTKS